MNNDIVNKKNSRLPPGQHETKRFPVLQKGRVSHLNRKDFLLKIEGEIENSKTFTLKELGILKDKEIVEDIHCVTS